jgi:transposase-like protein
MAHPIPCPFCKAALAELVSLFGSQLLLSQYRCTACGSYFEGLRSDRWDAEPVATVDKGVEHGC